MSTTPGPWDYAYEGRPTPVIPAATPKAFVFSVGVGTVARNIANWEDARLIAASPTLLQACERIGQLAKEQIESGTQTVAALEERVGLLQEIARAAIAKAKGDQ